MSYYFCWWLNSLKKRHTSYSRFISKRWGCDSFILWMVKKSWPYFTRSYEEALSWTKKRQNFEDARLQHSIKFSFLWKDKRCERNRHCIFCTGGNYGKFNERKLVIFWRKQYKSSRCLFGELFNKTSQKIRRKWNNDELIFK